MENVPVQQASLFEDEGMQRVSWEPSRQAGLARLQHFQPLAGARYAKTRNFDLGADDRSNVSCLSPWIRSRAVTEEEVLEQVLQRFDVYAAEKFIQEVFWRGYFKGWLEHRPSVWQTFCQDLEALQQRMATDEDLIARYQAAVEGRTGIDCFDHWAAELVETGYLHNHARMWFASIWIFTLNLPWQLGAGFFLTHLLDGDPAANTLSWRWVGGLHTKGKHYLARADNIARCTQGRFNPAGQLNEFATPLWEEGEHPLAPLVPPATWPNPRRYGLLISEEDVHVDSLPLPTPPAALALLPVAASCGPVDLSPQVVAFRTALMQDAAAAAAAYSEAPCATLAERSARHLIDWAQGEGLDAVVMAAPPVGPTRDFWLSVMHELNAAGLDTHTVTRRYDQLVWPHATAGFFKLKKKIPKILTALNLQ